MGCGCFRDSSAVRPFGVADGHHRRSAIVASTERGRCDDDDDRNSRIDGGGAGTMAAVVPFSRPIHWRRGQKGGRRIAEEISPRHSSMQMSHAPAGPFAALPIRTVAEECHSDNEYAGSEREGAVRRGVGLGTEYSGTGKNIDARGDVERDGSLESLSQLQTQVVNARVSNLRWWLWQELLTGGAEVGHSPNVGGGSRDQPRERSAILGTALYWKQPAALAHTEWRHPSLPQEYDECQSSMIVDDGDSAVVVPLSLPWPPASGDIVDASTWLTTPRGVRVCLRHAAQSGDDSNTAGVADADSILSVPLNAGWLFRAIAPNVTKRSLACDLDRRARIAAVLSTGAASEMTPSRIRRPSCEGGRIGAVAAADDRLAALLPLVFARTSTSENYAYFRNGPQCRR